MQYTLVGLPNTCSVCGKPLTREDGWYAEHDDAARSGAGVCADHVVETTPQSEAEPTDATIPPGEIPIETTHGVPVPDAPLPIETKPKSKRAKKKDAK